MTTTKPNPDWMAEEADCRLVNITAEGLNQEIQDLTSLGCRLALELECLLLECEDTAAVSKWWNSAQSALEDWRSHLWSVSHGPAGELTANQMANHAKTSGSPVTEKKAQQDDPCPGCRKGRVCRTPKCGRLKLPSDHPCRAEQPQQEKCPKCKGLGYYDEGHENDDGSMSGGDYVECEKCKP